MVETPTPTPPPTPIPTVVYDTTEIIPTAGQIGSDVQALFASNPAFLGLAGVLLVFGILMLIRGWIRWRNVE